MVPDRLPSKLVCGMSREVKKTTGSGIVQVGILYGPMRKDGFVPCDLTTSAERSRKTHTLYFRQLEPLVESVHRFISTLNLEC